MSASPLARMRGGLFLARLRPVWLAVGITVLLAACYLIGYRVVYADRIFPGVTARGIDLGGMTRPEARDLLSSRLRLLSDAPLTLQIGDRQWHVPRASLGAHYDVDHVVDVAYSTGRSGSVMSDLLGAPVLRMSHRDISVTLLVDDADWKSVLDPVAASIDRPAVDAKLTIESNRRPEVSKDHDGSQLDRAAAQRLMTAALVAESTAVIKVPILTLTPRVRADNLEPARQQGQRLLSGPVQLTYAGQSWILGVDEIQSALILPGSPPNDNSTSLQIDPRLLSQLVDRIGADIDRPPRDASLSLEGDRFVLHPSQTARQLERSATIARLGATLFADQRSIAPVVDETPPNIQDGDLQAALARANTIVGSDLVIRAPDSGAWKLSSATLRQMIVVPDPAAIKGGDLPRLDPAKVAPFVAKLAKEVDHQPFNARFQRNASGGVQVIRDSAAGVTVTQSDTVARIVDGATGSDRTVPLAAQTVAPAVSSQDADAVASLGLIADNATPYGFSIPPRRHNVELATSLLNGVVIGPGEVFSFNHEMGPTTLDRGFQVGYGIQAQGDAVKTVPSVAGGICQVATTLFQPVFWTGYTIEERYSHAYWIAHYMSHGDVGLDTTVDEEAGLDFRFKNDTNSPILIQSSTDGSNVHFAIYGVPPQWTVKVDPPVISNLVKTDPKPMLQPDPTLPKGRMIVTEAAEDGFLAVVHRSVIDAAGNSRDLYLRSSYAPSHNVTMVGTKT